MACGTHPKTPGSPLLPAIRNAHATVRRTCDARLPAPSADQRNSQSRGKVVTSHPSERSGSSLAKQASTTPACRWTLHATNFCFLHAGDQSNQRRTAAPLLPFLTRKWPKYGRRARTAPLSAIANHSICPRQAMTAQSTPEAWKWFRNAEDGKASPTYDDAKNMHAFPW